MGLKSCPDEHVLLNTQLITSNNHVLTASGQYPLNFWAFSVHLTKIQVLFTQTTLCMFICTVGKFPWVYNFCVTTLYYFSVLFTRSFKILRGIVKAKVMAGRHNFISGTDRKDSF